MQLVLQSSSDLAARTREAHRGVDYGHPRINLLRWRHRGGVRPTVRRVARRSSAVLRLPRTDNCSLPLERASTPFHKAALPWARRRSLTGAATWRMNGSPRPWPLPASIVRARRRPHPGRSVLSVRNPLPLASHHQTGPARKEVWRRAQPSASQTLACRCTQLASSPLPLTPWASRDRDRSACSRPDGLRSHPRSSMCTISSTSCAYKPTSRSLPLTRTLNMPLTRAPTNNPNGSIP